MKKKVNNLIGYACLSSLLCVSQTAFGLQNGDALVFDSSSSYFAMGGGAYGTVPISSHDGIIIGTAQPASGSHGGLPNGTEDPSIDQPWSFFANTGMSMTQAGSNGITIVDDDGAGTYTLDFSAFGVTWNGIPFIPLGGAPTIPTDTGTATLVCSTPACGDGDSYVLDYQAHVPFGDPSNFGGVQYDLHLEGTVGAGALFLNYNIALPGGPVQECTSHDGNAVEMAVENLIIPEDDEVKSIMWRIDGEDAGQGMIITPTLGLGDHGVIVFVETINGLSAAKTTSVEVVDTVRPTPVAEFIATSTGMAVTELSHSERVSLRIEASDTCDPAPEITSILRREDGIDVNNGDEFTALINGKTNINQFEDTLRLSVTARDASGNATSTSTLLNMSK